MFCTSAGTAGSVDWDQASQREIGEVLPNSTHCATYCTPCRPLIRAFSGWIRTPPPTNLHSFDLADYAKIDMLGSRYKSNNFGAEKSQAWLLRPWYPVSFGTCTHLTWVTFPRRVTPCHGASARGACFTTRRATRSRLTLQTRIRRNGRPLIPLTTKP